MASNRHSRSSAAPYGFSSPLPVENGSTTRQCRSRSNQLSVHFIQVTGEEQAIYDLFLAEDLIELHEHVFMHIGIERTAEDERLSLVFDLSMMDTNLVFALPH